MTDIAVIIPHYADAERLNRCLTALLAQDLSGVEVVVVDNATPGGIVEVAASFPRIDVVTELQKGAAAARNRGVAETTAPWLAFLDADCVPASDWLDIVRRIAEAPCDIITGGRIDVFDETPPPRSGAEAFETVFAFDQEVYICDKGFSVTANLIASREAFECIGPFREGVSEDVDWCHRATAAGYELRYDADLAVGHPTRGDWAALAKKWRRLTREAFGLKGQGGRNRMLWALRGLAMAPSVLLHLPYILKHPHLSWPERLKAAGTLARLRITRMVWMLRQVLGLAV